MNSKLRTKRQFAAITVFFMMLFASIASIDLKAQDNGPTNYCIPNIQYVPLMMQWYGANSPIWCYPKYIKSISTYYMYYFTVPILETQIVDVASGEIKMDRQSRDNPGYSGQNMGEFEDCYVYTGARGEMEPGGIFDIKSWHNINYYGYNGTDYCSYGYTSTYDFRVFIDYNIDGDFSDMGEWVNDPANIASGATQKIGSTHDWRYNSNCQTNYLEQYRIKIADNQAIGVTRMRILSSYYYPYSLGYGLGLSGDACWNGYFFDYSMYGYPPGSYYGYNYGEAEDYLIEFVISIKATFPDNKSPNDILLANEVYDGTRTGFERPYITLGGPQPAGTLLTYQIIGPMPSTTVVYTGIDPTTGSNQMGIGVDKLGTNLKYNIQKATGEAVVGNYGFKRLSGGEYQLVLGIKKPGQPDFKSIKRNFTISWEWDLAATAISRPLSNGAPRYFKYPRGLNMDLQAEVQNVGLRGIAKFDAYYEIYNSKGEQQTSLVRHWDTANYGEFVVAAKQKVLLDFGSWKTQSPDIYKVYLRVDLKSAADLELFNNQFTRPGDPVFTFEVRDEISAQAYSIDAPKDGSDIIAGRPFVPIVVLKNVGVGDITNCPTTITVTEEPGGKFVFSDLINVQDIPSGRYNTKTVRYNPRVILKKGTYRLTLEVNHPDDMVKEDNKISIVFYVKEGLTGPYTIGSKNSGQTNNYATVNDAVNDLFLRGLSGPIEYELTDAEYTITSPNDYSPALDLSTAIMGSGANNTITFKPSIDKSVTRGSIKINLISNNGIGVYMGQSLISSVSTSVQNETYGTAAFLDYCNNAGYITFDGGINQSLKFVLKSDKTAFGSVFYLNAGSNNINIKNIIMENGSPNLQCSVKLPNVTFSVVDGFVWTADQTLTETGYQGYSAGIVSRGKVQSLKNETFVLALDTITNNNNTFANNDISGFGYGIVSYGIGPLRVPELQEYRAFNNKNTSITGNKIYNVTGGGIVVGHEQNSKVSGNVIFDVNGNCGSFAAGIIAGGNSTQDLQGYNNVNLTIDGNQISNVRGTNAVYGILVDQNANKYPLGSKFQTFPDVDDNIMVTNNAMFDLKAKSSNTMRVGIHALTERNHQIADAVTQLLTPRYTDLSIRKLFIANNTVILNEDGVANNGNIAGIGIQQAFNPKVYNNAVAITDGNISPNNLVASAVFYQGVYPKVSGGLIADRNAYWLAGSSATAYRHVFNDWKNRIIENGNRNEYLNLEQWQMASRSELNSVSNGNFVNDYYYAGTYPVELKVKSTVKGSVLSKRGDRFTSYDKDMNGVIRGQAGSRYDIGAIEFNGSLYNRDAEMLVITAPGTYRATDGTFNDAEYTMTDAPITVKALVRNSGSLAFSDKKIYAKIYRETPAGTWSQEGNTIEAKVDINENEHYEVNFNLADGIGDEFIPKTYNDLRGDSYTVPPQFLGMTPNVTPRYKIVVSTDVDEFNNNNSTEKIVRFYLSKSPVKVLVSSQNYVDTKAAGLTVDQLASGLNKEAVDFGMKRIGWEIQLANARYDYDVFQRAGWEPRNVNYSIYRSMLWSDGNENALTRLQKLDITSFINSGSFGEKKNLALMSQEMVRLNTNINDPDEVFVRDILRGENRFPGNPLGTNASYAGRKVTGVTLGRDLVYDIKATGVANDANPMPGLMNILETGDGISRMAIRYNDVQDVSWPDAARIGGIATSNLVSTVLYVGIDWRHFGDIEKIIRGSFDFAEGNGGVVVSVELLNFDAVKSGKRVDISWSTASEQNSVKFEIERAEITSAGKSIFSKIDEMPAAGKSNITKYYGPIVDNNVEFGKSYSYRLKMYDRDGKSEYSGEKVVTLDGISGNAWIGLVKPNPVMTLSTVEYGLGNNMDIEIKLYDVQGKEVMTLANGYKNAGVYTFELNAGDLLSGSYTIVLKSGDILLTEKVNIAK
jgi:hypothetical protein